MQIFNYIDGVFELFQIKEIEGGVYVSHFMATVIDNDIRNTQLPNYRIQKCGIILTTDSYRNLIGFRSNISLINIYTNNGCYGPRYLFQSTKLPP